MKKKIVIIGGGVAGLSAGIYARMNGFDAEIVEMHTVPGGQCTAWKRKAYTFDYCIHWLVGSSHGVFAKLWRETGGLDDNVQIVDPKEYSHFTNEEGEEFTILSDVNQWEKYLIKRFPEDVNGIRKMCADMRKASYLPEMEDPPGLRKMGKTMKVMLHSVPFLRLYFKYKNTSAFTYFEKLNLKNQTLSGFLNRMVGEIDFSAIAFLVMLSWFSDKNAGYPLGGSLPFASRMANKFKALGGKLTLGKAVQKILIDNNTAVGVELKDGKQIMADLVISAADLHATHYKMLGGKYITSKIKNAFENWSLFEPVVQVSFGINKSIQTPHHSLSVLQKGESIGATKLSYGYTISNYNHDPVITPEGKCIMKLLYNTSWDLWKGMDETEYALEKQCIAKDAEACLLKQFPDAKGAIEVVDVATPLTDVKYTGVYRGAYEGFMPSAKNMTKSIPMSVPGLKNFYQIGQWLSPGGGLPPSVQSGKWVLQLICKSERMKFKVT